MRRPWARAVAWVAVLAAWGMLLGGNCSGGMSVDVLVDPTTTVATTTGLGGVGTAGAYHNTGGVTISGTYTSGGGYPGGRAGISPSPLPAGQPLGRWP